MLRLFRCNLPAEGVVQRRRLMSTTGAHHHFRAVVIGGGVVGASVLYHLARHGWTDVAMIERCELTAGSTWHAAAGFHAQNKDANIAGLQAYTIKLYNEIEQESGLSVGLKKTGGFSLAGTKERFESLKTEWAHFKSKVRKGSRAR